MHCVSVSTGKVIEPTEVSDNAAAWAGLLCFVKRKAGAGKYCRYLYMSDLHLIITQSLNGNSTTTIQSSLGAERNNMDQLLFRWLSRPGGQAYKIRCVGFSHFPVVIISLARSFTLIYNTCKVNGL